MALSAAYRFFDDGSCSIAKKKCREAVFTGFTQKNRGNPLFIKGKCAMIMQGLPEKAVPAL